MSKQIRERLKIIFLLFSLFFAILLLRLSYFQIYKSPVLTQQANDSHNYYFPAEMYLRGDIVDCNGESLLDGREKPALVVTPGMLRNSDNIKSFAHLLEVEPSKLEKEILQIGGGLYGNIYNKGNKHSL